MYSLMAGKVSSYSGPYPFESTLLRAAKNDRSRSAYRDINLFNVASLLVRDCISFFVVCIRIWLIACVRPEKFQFLKKGQNCNFGYKIVISIKNPKFIL